MFGCLLLVVLIKEQGEERTGSGAEQGRAGQVGLLKSNAVKVGRK